MNIALWLDQTRADLLYGLRQLKLSPAFTAVAVLSLALGIGANTAIFQLVNAIRMKSLPVKDPQQLAIIKYARPSHRSGWGSSRSAEFTCAQWKELQAQHEPFSGVLAFSAARFNSRPAASRVSPRGFTQAAISLRSSAFLRFWGAPSRRKTMPIPVMQPPSSAMHSGSVNSVAICKCSAANSASTVTPFP